MNNFKLYPTRILFGKGAIVVSRSDPQDARVLITYGGGSVKRPYWRSSGSVKGLDVREFGGIEPNPS